MKNHEIQDQVRARYGAIAAGAKNSCCGPTSSCCGGSAVTADKIAQAIGYSPEQLANIPGNANLGLGCGNPTALSELKPGEKVLDLGSGAGFDCFLAAQKVGKEGLVVGVDMTAEMISQARENAEKSEFSQVEFHLGEIEHLPAPDNFFDIAISNCVINLSTDKRQVFREIFRALKPGGRFVISDLVLTKPLPASVKSSVEAYAACIAGALLKTEYLQIVKDLGFTEVKILNQSVYALDMIVSDPTVQLIIADNKISREDQKAAAEAVLSITLHAVKPA